MKRKVHVQGHSKTLYVDVDGGGCGDIEMGDGVVFWFGDEGGWVVPLEELRSIVAEADASEEREMHRRRDASIARARAHQQGSRR